MRTKLWSIVLSSAAVAMLTACGSGDDSSATSPTEAGPDATSTLDDGSSNDSGSVNDASDATDGSVDGSAPQFLLLTYTPDYASSEYLAYDLIGRSVTGTLSYLGGGTNVSTNASPWVLQQQNDVVVKMSPAAPGTPLSSWSVAEPTDASGYFAYANPTAVAEVGAKAYVSLYNRNNIAVLDTSLAVDAGVPSKTIDLSSLVQSDGDGNVEAAALAYDATRQRLWVVIDNLNESGTFIACDPALKSEVVAIDTTTDTLVSGLIYPLTGYDPTSIVYDAPNDRLLVMSAGCKSALTDGGPGALSAALVEQIALANGQSTVLLDTTTEGGYGQLVYVDAHHAFLWFYTGSYAWDPTSTTIGAAIPNAPDSFTWDGHGLLGPKQEYLSDGGVGSIDLIDVDPGAGTVTTIGSNPVAIPDGTWEGIDTWPHP